MYITCPKGILFYKKCLIRFNIKSKHFTLVKSCGEFWIIIGRGVKLSPLLFRNQLVTNKIINKWILNNLDTKYKEVWRVIDKKFVLVSKMREKLIK